MTRFAMITLAVMLGLVASASGATFHARVETDKTVYLPGETVHWTIHAWVLPEDNTDGIGLISINLADSLGDTMQQADREEVFPDTGLYQLAGTDFGFLQGMATQGFGTVHPETGELLDILAADPAPYDHVSNLGEDNGLAPLPLFAQGSYQVYEVGAHTLQLEVHAATYWESPTIGHSTAFEADMPQNANFEVVPEPATMLLLGTGLLTAFVVRRRKNHVN